MGYRSDVKMVIIGDKEPMRAELASLVMTDPGVAERIQDKAGGLRIFEDGKNLVLTLRGEDWKWYPNYPDVQAYERIWSHFESLEKGAGPQDPVYTGSFARLGEEDNDIEISAFGEESYELIELRRSTICSYLDMDAPDIRASFSKA
jgi:hypothetical protein